VQPVGWEVGRKRGKLADWKVLQSVPAWRGPRGAKSKVVLSVAIWSNQTIASLDRQLWLVVLGKLKAVVDAERPNCSGCGGQLKSNGSRVRVHHNLAGTVSFRGQRLRCLNCLKM